jgi:predicted lipoprotein with Yx(FWY)xxD motif
MRRSTRVRSSALGVLVGLPAVALMLAACGGGSGASGYGAPSGGSGNTASGMVSVKQVAAFGPLLEDGAGNTVYYNDEESGGMWKCTADCLGFWYPVPGSANPGNVPGLGTIQRGDNHQQQLTYQGKPLYTFRLDSPGQRQGDNLADDFASTHFTWHAAATGPVTNPAPPKTLTNGGIAPVPGGGSTAPTTGDSGGGYGDGGYGGGGY